MTKNIFTYLLEARLLSNYIDVSDSLRHLLTRSLTGRLAFSPISPLFVVRFGRSFRFCYLEFDKKAIYDGLYTFKFHGFFSIF